MGSHNAVLTSMAGFWASFEKSVFVGGTTMLSLSCSLRYHLFLTPTETSFHDLRR